MSLSNNQIAFLTMLAVSEGTAYLGDRGYNVLVGGELFDSYADHPRQLVRLNDNLSSTAAGRYQILAKTFDEYQELLNLPDFSPMSQDCIAIQLCKERGALPFIACGEISNAIDKVKNIWASLPGAGYGQHENGFPMLLGAYQAVGGQLA